MHKALHRKDDINRLYVLRKGGSGLASIKDSVDPSIWRLEDYIKKRKERLITASSNSNGDIRANRTMSRKQKWKEKQLYGYFKWNFAQENLYVATKKNLRRETESFQITTQNNTIRTDGIKAEIDKMQQNSKCRLCGDRNETINHIIIKCCKVAQNNARLDMTG